MTSAPVCLVTGGAGPAIGQGICRALGQAGWHVIVADRNHGAARTFARELGQNATAVTLDVSSHDSIETGVADVLQAHGGIDGLVNSAGVGLERPIHLATGEDFDRIIGVDLRGVWECSKAVLPSMIERGAGNIVNISSNHAIASMADYGVYAAAKAGVLGLTRGIALDYGRHGIRCNAVLPGLVEAVTTRNVAREPAVRNDFLQNWTTTCQAIPRPIDPIDIGNVVEFLLSDRSRAITGAALVADAGTTTLLVDQHVNHTEKR